MGLVVSGISGCLSSLEVKAKMEMKIKLDFDMLGVLLNKS